MRFPISTRRALPVGLVAAAVALSVPSTGSARLIDAERMHSAYPVVEPLGAVRKGERFVRLNARLSSPVKVRSDLIVTCVPDVGRDRTRRKRVTGVGGVRIRIRTPRLRAGHCFASAVVNLADVGAPAPVLLRAALHGKRRR